MERAVRLRFTENFEGLALWCGRESEEAQTPVLALTEHILHKDVLCLNLINRLLLQFCIFFKSVRNISKGGFQLHGGLPGLAAVRFIHYDGVVLSNSRLYLLIDHRELLQGGDDDALALVDGVQ